jgi:hypothetical protein
MTMEMARTDDWVPMLSRVADLATQIAGTDLVPKAYRNDPDTIAGIILRGREIGLPPMTALAACYSINGRVGLYAEAQRALVLAAGHELWFEDASGQSVTACGRRKGTNTVHKVTWTGDMARAAGLNTGPHKQYPRQLLKARASAELMRDVFPDVIGGFAAVEEMEDTEPDTPPPVTRAKRSTPVRAAPPELDTAPPAWDEPEPEDPDPITEKQLRLLHVLANDLGLADRDERLSAASSVILRRVDSFSNLTKREAHNLIDTWQPIIEGNMQ